MVLPAFVDMHTHLDKGHIWPRSPNPDGTFMGALTTVGADRAARWTAADVAARMEFSLRCAYAHGTRAIRTHLDSHPAAGCDQLSRSSASCGPNGPGGSTLQAACLIGLRRGFRPTGLSAAPPTSWRESGGVLGMVTYPMPDLKDRCRLLPHGRRAGPVGGFPCGRDGRSERRRTPCALIAEAVLETGLSPPRGGGALLFARSMEEARRCPRWTLWPRPGCMWSACRCATCIPAGPHAHRTPRWRGITLVHEMKARGIGVSFASDNTRDPFYAYGDWT
jgi:cytosine/creatinine deaminase